MKEGRYGYEFIEDVGYVVHDNEMKSYCDTFNTEKEAAAYCQPEKTEYDSVGMPLNGWAAIITG